MPSTSLDDVHVASCSVLSNRTELLRRLPQGSRGAEIGVAFGDFTADILAIVAPSLLHLVDAWEQERYQTGLAEIRKRLSDGIAAGKVQIHQGLSTDVLPRLEPDSLDWVYVDTNHSYQTTREELALCEKLVRRDGLICGHDFSTGNPVTPVVYGVVPAVAEFCKSRNWRFRYLTLESDGYFSFALERINGAAAG